VVYVCVQGGCSVSRAFPVHWPLSRMGTGLDKISTRCRCEPDANAGRALRSLNSSRGNAWEGAVAEQCCRSISQALLKIWAAGRPRLHVSPSRLWDQLLRSSQAPDTVQRYQKWVRSLALGALSHLQSGMY